MLRSWRQSVGASLALRPLRVSIFGSKEIHMKVRTLPSYIQSAGLSAAVLLLGASGAAWSADMDAARAAYKEQRAACESGNTHQDRATCLREAGAALEEARRGQLSRGVTEEQRRA